MKKFTLPFLLLFLIITNSYAQIEVTKITANNEDHYIVTTIGYPIAGMYPVKNKIEPITLLNEDGTGSIQNEDLSKNEIMWGIESSESGIPIFKEGFNSASYSLWYKNIQPNKSGKDGESDWIYTQFSIHYDKHKMYISGERVKDYMD